MIENEPLVRVTREALKKGYRFVGTYADGEVIVLRAMATKPYTHAAIHSRPVTSKFRKYLPRPAGSDLWEIDRSERRQFVTFHSSNRVRPAHVKDAIEQVIEIEAV